MRKQLRHQGDADADATSAQGSACSSTPSITSFIRVAWGAGSSGLPKP
jgi:hypothetical protein